MASNYHIAAVKNSLPDVQLSNLWEVRIQVPDGLVSSVEGVEIPQTKELMIRAKTCSIPGRKIPNIETRYMGMVSNYAGTEDMSGKTLNISFYEYEDQYITRALNTWVNNIFNSMDSRNSMGGHGLAGQKYPNNTRGFAYSGDIKLRLLGKDGEPLGKGVIFHDAWPTSVGDISLTYENSNGLENEVTFQYDWWELTDRVE